MEIGVVGANHKTTPVEIRGKFAIGSSQLKEAIFSLHNYVSQGIILCTCNRTEVYFLSKNGDLDREASIDFLNSRANLPREELEKYIYVYHNEEAIRHLIHVAAGLDSMITGEYEILGQVRRALEVAEQTALVRLPLLELFRCAVRVGRRVRTETGISKNALSVSSVAVSLATQKVGDIRRCKVVVIGASEAGRLVAKSCRERGASEIVVVSRSQEKGTALAAMLHGIWVPMENLGRELTACDLVISCSGAPHSILKLDLVKEVMDMRSYRPLVIVDIAVPQDVESRVKELDSVFIYDIDELTSICRSNHKERQKEIQRANEIAEDEIRRFISYWETLEIKPIIKELVRKIDKIRQTQLDMTLKKLRRLSATERAYVDAMSKAIVKKILHDPIRCLKHNHEEDEYIQIINDLFCLKGQRDK